MTRRPVAFFNLNEDDLFNENIDATAEATLAVLLEARSGDKRMEKEPDGNPGEANSRTYHSARSLWQPLPDG